MNDYFTAYRNRIQNVNNELLRIANELTSKGYKVYYSKDGLITFICIEDDEKQVTFEFNDTPYRWTISYSIEPSRKHGSGKIYKEEWGADNPFTIDDIIKAMQPIPKRMHPHEGYLKLHTL